MRYRLKFRMAGCLGLLCLLAQPAVASDDFWYAEFTPGFEFLREGIAYYESGDYERALEKFESAAFWADKTAQAQLGRMHALGQGVVRDPARGWAWLKLAAERGYPQFVSTTDTVWEALPPGQRDKATTILEEELEPEYGDDVAIPRTDRRMSRDLRRTTGSRLGANYYPRTIEHHAAEEGGEAYFSGETFYARDLWDFRRIVELETKLFKARASGRVEIRELENDESGDDQER